MSPAPSGAWMEARMDLKGGRRGGEAVSGGHVGTQTAARCQLSTHFIWSRGSSAERESPEPSEGVGARGSGAFAVAIGVCGVRQFGLVGWILTVTLNEGIAHTIRRLRYPGGPRSGNGTLGHWAFSQFLTWKAIARSRGAGGCVAQCFGAMGAANVGWGGGCHCAGDGRGAMLSAALEREPGQLPPSRAPAGSARNRASVGQLACDAKVGPER